jgi:hypothetical protein
MPARLPRHAVTRQVRPQAMTQGSVAEPRPPQVSGRHDDGEDERGEKNTGGRRGSPGASQRPGRLPQRRLLGRVRDIMRRIPCGYRACGVTVPGSRCKSFVLLVLCGERVPSLLLLAPRGRYSVPRKHLRNCKLQYTDNNTEPGSVKNFDRVPEPCG